MTYSPQCVRCFVASKLVSGETTTHLPQVPRCGQTWTQTGLDGPNSLLWFYPEKNQAGNNKAFLLSLAEHYQIFFASLTHITLHIFYTDQQISSATLFLRNVQRSVFEAHHIFFPNCKNSPEAPSITSLTTCAAPEANTFLKASKCPLEKSLVQ